MSSHHSLSAPLGELIGQATSEDRSTENSPQGKVASTGGICRTCDNRTECTFLNTGAGVLNCDELDYPSPSSALNATPGSPALRPAPETPPDESQDNLIGLCRTCENRFDCQFPKPAGGVWSCDEFV